MKASKSSMTGRFPDQFTRKFEVKSDCHRGMVLSRDPVFVVGATLVVALFFVPISDGYNPMIIIKKRYLKRFFLF